VLPPLDPGSGSTTTVTATGGRPLGLENLPDERILVCDAHRGLLALDPASGDLETLLTEVDGDRLIFTNNAAVAPDGTIWFSDSSRIWPIEEWKNDLIEHTCTGRLLRRTPDGEVTTVLDRLCFANGVALTAEMDAVLVAETGTRTIRRVALGADGSPRATTTWVDDLPAGTAQAHPETHRPGAGPGQRRAHGARPGLRRHALAPGDRGARARRSGLARQPRRTGDRVVRRARGPLVTSRRAPRG
jgi:sugar lactone lactonase YvrE